MAQRLLLALALLSLLLPRPAAPDGHEGQSNVHEGQSNVHSAPSTQQQHKKHALTPLQASFKGKIEIVIGRYKEPLQQLAWLFKYPHTIYNRAPSDDEDVRAKIPVDVANDLTIVPEPTNVGKESHIYLSHIIKHYHNLPDILVFAQAVNKNKNAYNMEALGYTDESFQSDVEALAEGRVVFVPQNDGFMFLNWFCFPVFQPRSWVLWFDSVYYPRKNVHTLIKKGFEDIDATKAVKNYRFSPTGVFAVHRSAVLRRPKAFYEELRERISGEIDPPLGHFFERAWSAIFLSNCTSGLDYFCQPAHRFSQNCSCAETMYFNKHFNMNVCVPQSMEKAWTDDEGVT